MTKLKAATKENFCCPKNQKRKKLYNMTTKNIYKKIYALDDAPYSQS